MNAPTEERIVAVSGLYSDRYLVWIGDVQAKRVLNGTGGMFPFCENPKDCERVYKSQIPQSIHRAIAVVWGGYLWTPEEDT